jgi:hypothetical protein
LHVVTMQYASFWFTRMVSTLALAGQAGALLCASACAGELATPPQDNVPSPGSASISEGRNDRASITPNAPSTSSAAPKPDADAPLGPTNRCGIPDWMFGGFALRRFECRETGSEGASRFQFINISCSSDVPGKWSAWLGYPDGPESNGTIERIGEEFVYRASSPNQPLSFKLAPTSLFDQQPGLLLSSLEENDPWQNWAIPQTTLPSLAHGLMPGDLLAIRSDWSLRTFDDQENAPRLRGTTRFSGTKGQDGDRRTRLTIRKENVGNLWFLDFESGGPARAPNPPRILSFFGEVSNKRWNAGLYADLWGGDVCAYRRSSVRFEGTVSGWSFHIDWLIPDINDIDNDGDRDERIIRTTNYELERGSFSVPK